MRGAFNLHNSLVGINNMAPVRKVKAKGEPGIACMEDIGAINNMVDERRLHKFVRNQSRRRSGCKSCLFCSVLPARKGGGGSCQWLLFRNKKKKKKRQHVI